MTPLGLREICAHYTTRHQHRRSQMLDKNPDFLTVFWLSLAAISGALGGCGAASIVGLSRSKLLISHFLAYMFIGAVCGGLSYAFGHFFGRPDDAKAVLGWAMFVGAGVPLILAAHNFGARYAFKFLGVEMELRLRKKGGEEKEL